MTEEEQRQAEEKAGPTNLVGTNFLAWVLRGNNDEIAIPLQVSKCTPGGMCENCIASLKGNVANLFTLNQGFAVSVQGHHGQPVSLAHPDVACRFADKR